MSKKKKSKLPIGERRKLERLEKERVRAELEKKNRLLKPGDHHILECAACGEVPIKRLRYNAAFYCPTCWSELKLGLIPAGPNARRARQPDDNVERLRPGQGDSAGPYK